MPLPGIEIPFQNGNLGQVVDVPDGVFGLIASAAAVALTFALNTPYKVRSMEDVAALGIIPSIDNHVMYKALSEFYAEAEEGTPLWLMGMAKTTKVSDWFTIVNGKTPAEKLLDEANGEIKMLFTAFAPTGAYVLTIANGMDTDVLVAANLAQILADSYTAKKYAPFHTLLEAYGFNGTHTALPNLLQSDFNRIRIFVGDTETRTGTSASKGAAVGILAGRLSRIQVHVNPGKVIDGPLTNLVAYILDEKVDQYNVEALHDKGFTTFRKHAKKSGYYISDDPMACAVSDDYHYGNRRRVIDKAYELAYEATLDFLLAENDVLSNGTISPIYATTVEDKVETLIFSQMSSNGELSYNRNDPKDRGVICKMDLTHNVSSTSKLKFASLHIRSKGTNRWIEVAIGFLPVTLN